MPERVKQILQITNSEARLIGGLIEEKSIKYRMASEDIDFKTSERVMAGIEADRYQHIADSFKRVSQINIK